mmetsp:Transcript_2408/g.6074  ORF Transcript_2408/g.6074 Transcript_2408/m.6074 type:complete len:293 (-) Transcript_2408:169-1047(-)
MGPRPRLGGGGGGAPAATAHLDAGLDDVQRSRQGGRDRAPDRAGEQVDVGDILEAPAFCAAVAGAIVDEAGATGAEGLPRLLGDHPVDSGEGHVPGQGGDGAAPERREGVLAVGEAAPIEVEARLRARAPPLKRRRDDHCQRARDGARKHRRLQLRAGAEELALQQAPLQRLVGRHVDPNLRHRHGQRRRRAAPKHLQALAPHYLPRRVERPAVKVLARPALRRACRVGRGGLGAPERGRHVNARAAGHGQAAGRRGAQPRVLRANGAEELPPADSPLLRPDSLAAHLRARP